VSGGKGERCASRARSSSLYDRFMDALREHRPQLAAAEAERLAAARARAEESHKLAALFGKTARPASAAAVAEKELEPAGAVSAAADTAPCFAFGFGSTPAHSSAEQGGFRFGFGA
jgi:hypothetical protein